MLRIVFVLFYKWAFLLALPGAAGKYKLREDLTSHPNWKLIDRGEDCGHNIADRIIGGKEATLGQYPWIARLGYTLSANSNGQSNEYKYECGGTIINSKYILTAAHCSPDIIGIKLVAVRLGEHDMRTDPDCENGGCAPRVQDIAVEKYLCHDYNSQTFKNDICLLRLAKPIEFNDYVSPICLPVYEILRKMNFEGKAMEVAGWGIADIHTGKSSDILLTLKVPIKSQHMCALAYSGKAKIVSTQLCAGGVIGKDSCGGDSGGPLMAPFSLDAPPRVFLIGVVSFGPSKCADSATPGVYTKVAEYMQWILDNVKE